MSGKGIGIKMEDNIFDKIHDVDLQKTMETSYIDYAILTKAP